MNRVFRWLAVALRAFPLAAISCASNRGKPVREMGNDTAATPNRMADGGSRDVLASTAPDADERAERLVARMTLEEKLAYIGGDRDFYIRAVPRLGIPEIKMSDGPAGCRNWGPNTAFPAAIALAASFDVTLVEEVGRAIGRDCRARGVHILLAPGMNIQRSPLNGRNFEYLGEDPLLAGKTAAAFIRGVQSEGVLCTAKHFAGNNQEWDRNHISSEIEERTLREIYFPAFERAVREGGVAAVMTAYNPLNGTFSSHNEWLVRKVLKGDWGFRGFVMSDWGAVHDGAAAAQAGLDLEMPRGAHMNLSTLTPLVADKRLDAANIDDKVRRILRTLVAAGFLDRPQKREDVPLDDPKSRAQALRAAEDSIVLLKNEGPLLPFDRTNLKRVAVIGPNADPAVIGGSGSAFVTALHGVSLLDGLREVAPDVEFVHHPGASQSSDARFLGKPCFAGPVQEQLFAGRALAGKPVAVRNVDRIRLGEGALPGSMSEDFSVRWTGNIAVSKKGAYRIVTNSDDGIRVFVDKKRVIENWSNHPATVDVATVDLAVGTHAVIIEYYQAGGGAVAEFGFAPASEVVAFEARDEVTALASNADAVIVAVGYGQSAETNSVRRAFQPYWPPGWARQAGLVESEDSDRPFELAPAQVETIRAAAAVNPRTVVVVNAGGGADLQPLVDKVPALLWAWYPGQEGGRALAEVLFGDVNPSGKLPVTFARRYADYPSAPFYNVKQDGKTPYGEGVFVGYRGFDARNVEPAFAFGHGLHFTTFQYSDIDVRSGADGAFVVSVRVANTGSRAGDEIIEAYVAPPNTGALRPPKELKGFARVSLAAGANRRVEVALEARAFAMWDDGSKAWKVQAGKYEIQVGASSRDIRLRKAIDVEERSIAR
jgi:beta-glucosidase